MESYKSFDEYSQDWIELSMDLATMDDSYTRELEQDLKQRLQQLEATLERLYPVEWYNLLATLHREDYPPTLTFSLLLEYKIGLETVLEESVPGSEEYMEAAFGLGLLLEKINRLYPLEYEVWKTEQDAQE